MSAIIKNQSIEPAVLPEPFNDVLPGLGHVVYEGTTQDIFARAKLAPPFYVQDAPDQARMKTLPGWKILTDNLISERLTVGANVLAGNSPDPLLAPTITPAMIGQRFTLQRGDYGGARDVNADASADQSFILTLGDPPSPTYTFSGSKFLAEFIAVTDGAGSFAWFLFSEVNQPA